MNTAFPFSDQLYGVWDSAKGYLADGISKVGASIAAGYHTQHNTDDTHGTITATGSVTERSRTTAMGDWINPDFDAKAFTITGAGNSLTVPSPAVNGNIAPLSYMVIGSTMFLNCGVAGATLVASGTAISVFRVRIPDNYLLAVSPAGSFNIRITNQPAYILNGAVQRLARVFVTPGDRTGVFVFRADGTNLADDGAFEFSFQLFFEIVP